MDQYLSVKLWSGRKVPSTSRWSAGAWERQYSLSLGNKDGWRSEKRMMNRAQKQLIAEYQLER
ncbi:hypothetical protein JW978_00930 [Candidatus Dojkabacteria bacterium]|nr:hypothetical protein [Candidatus Dojkabacteria bacterium]